MNNSFITFITKNNHIELQGLSNEYPILYTIPSSEYGMPMITITLIYLS